MKETIREFALGMGVEDLGFGSVADYKSPQSPKIETIFPGAKSLVVMAIRELSNLTSDNQRIAMGGRIDSMAFARSCAYKLARFIEKKCNATAMSTPISYPLNMKPENKFGLIADFSQRHAAIAAGLGNFGRHNLVIHPKLGSRVIFLTIITDLELPPDPPVTEDLCTHCNICVDNCPAHALDTEGQTDEFKCMKVSQPTGITANIKFWMKFSDGSSEDRKKLIFSPEYMSLYQSAFIGLEYHCFKCYISCPVGQ